MKRREFIALLTAAAVARSTTVFAQQPKRLPVVALVFSTAPSTEMKGADPISKTARAFVHAMRDLGWIDGRTVTMERSSAEGMPQRASVIFAELLERGVDVMMLAGERWLHEAALRATRTIPLVATFAEDPIAAGLIKSLARPDGNLTGITLTTGHELTLKRLQLLKELTSNVGRIAYLATQSAVEQYRRGAGFPGLSVMLVEVNRPEQYEEAFAAILRDRPDALMMSSSPVHYVNSQRIVTFTRENSLPAMFAFREAVEAGGLASYGANAPGLWRQGARLVDRVLRGSSPVDLPVEQPTAFELIINLTTAKALGLTIPPTLLVRADEVIE